MPKSDEQKIEELSTNIRKRLKKPLLKTPLSQLTVSDLLTLLTEFAQAAMEIEE